MSCSVHDLVRLERQGLPAVAVATQPFVDEAVEQAESLGMPRVAVVYVQHPVQLLEPDALRALADGVFARILNSLTSSR